jgi:putative transcriptional regulator
MPSLAGSFLVARPVLKDPTFRQTVVLLIEHGLDGAFGLVVNRPKRLKELPFLVFVGGPCKLQGMILLHGHPEWQEDADSEVAPGIFMGSEESLERVKEPAEEKYRCRIFSGYSGWGAQQLENELAAGAWSVVPASGDILFGTEARDLWASLVPPAFPEPSVN